MNGFYCIENMVDLGKGIIFRASELYHYVGLLVSYKLSIRGRLVHLVLLMLGGKIRIRVAARYFKNIGRAYLFLE